MPVAAIIGETFGTKVNSTFLDEEQTFVWCAHT